jgi:hypothetical protein
MQSNKFQFKVASFKVSDEHISVNIHALDTESDYAIKLKEFESWLMEGKSYIETEITPDVYSKSSIDEYWEYAREINNSDALAHLHMFLSEKLDSIKLWMEAEVVIDLFREKLMANNISIDYMDEASIRSALTKYGSSYANTIYSPVKAA